MTPIQSLLKEFGQAARIRNGVLTMDMRNHPTILDMQNRINAHTDPAAQQRGQALVEALMEQCRLIIFKDALAAVGEVLQTSTDVTAEEHQQIVSEVQQIQQALSENQEVVELCEKIVSAHKA